MARPPTRVDRPRHEWTPVQTLGVTVHAHVWPGPDSRPPVVLVAGLGVSGRYWSRLGGRLAGDRQVLAPDLPGFGRTPPVPGSSAGPSVREQADRLVAWMDARGIGTAVLVGHSVGCQAVVDVATRFPGRVERVVLAAPPFEPGRRSLAVSLPRLAAGAWVEAVSLPLLLVADYARTGPVRALQQARRSMDYPMETRLPQVAVPTLVVHGRCDPLVSRRWTRAVAALVPGAVRVEVERAGHAMHYSAAAVTAEVVRRFVNDEPVGTVPADDPRHDPPGPPQPIPTAARPAMDAVAIAAAWATGRRPAVGVAAAVAVAKHAAGLPPVARAAVDLACGVGLLAASRRRAGRGSVVVLGLYHLTAAVLTAKPTGPARAIGR